MLEPMPHACYNAVKTGAEAMEDDKTVDLTAYREGAGNLIPCARCARPIPADSTRCVHCGVHFQGKAWQFTRGGTGDIRMGGRWLPVVVLLVLAVLGGFLVLGLVALVV
jgi:hypothetical protein